ncbi:hypothetical protein BCR35DRAFT_145140 [Leucosporidium creatinivorum]|uniref:Uncharacterized protein n=1 Tax=Leucosporidium creatinivorum TaxID=106004 RepID=A0A1Y2EQK8_9BASI|nr:hypothetical protein BCR35DRAFT_145140 [Leucosporidium creatinivorum]
MVTFVNERMVNSVRRVEDASAIVFCGQRDWQTLDRWQKINVVLKAKQYYETIRAIAAARSTTGSAEASQPTTQASLAHLPSLTARQERRARVSQVELRGRWA